MGPRSTDRGSQGAADSGHSRHRAANPGGGDHSLLAEDPLTGLPWTETILPLVASWGAGSTVHAVCLHFSGLGILANVPALQSSHSLLREAAERLRAPMGDEDRLTRFSGNKLLVFTKRSDAGVRQLLVEIADRLEGFGTELDGRHLPEIRLGMAVFGGRGPAAVTDEALTAFLGEAAGETVPIEEVVTPRGPTDQLETPSEETARTEVAEPQRAIGEETPSTMIIRERSGQPPIRPSDETVTPPPPPPPTERPRPSAHRLILEEVEVIITGRVATAVATLTFEGRRVRGKAIGRSSEGQHLALMGEALAHALTDLLPAGHGVVFRQALPTPTDAGDVVVSVVEFLAPEHTEFLFGVALAEPDPVAGTAKAVLNAVNAPLDRLLEATP